MPAALREGLDLLSVKQLCNIRYVIQIGVKQVHKSVFAILFSVFAVAPAFAQETATPPVAQAVATAEPAAAVQAVRGQMIVTSDGRRVGRVYRVTNDGSPSIIYEGRIVTIPATTLSLDGANLVTTLTEREIDSNR